MEKYCYDNLESNCDTYGGLYQWNEVMQYTTVENIRGICPAGSHVPSDDDWKILEIQLGMTQEQVDATGWRGTDQGTRLMSSTGLDVKIAGYRFPDGSWGNLLSYGRLLSSTTSSGAYWQRILQSANSKIVRESNDDSRYGFSVRCLGN